MRYLFARLDEKHKLLGNFEKILKTFDKNSIEKLNFERVLEKLLLKIEPSEITPFFYNNFSISGGGRSLCSPPGGAYVFPPSVSNGISYQLSP